MRPAAALLALSLCLAAAACDDEPASDARDKKVVATENQHKLPQWLTAQDKIEPAVWLRSREVGREVLASDPEVDRLRRAFHQTETRFFEDERMIANRTAQTGDMLAEIGQAERAVDIMTGMIDVADVTPKKLPYGDLCQHYVNLRKTGQDRSAALSQLSEAYKAQNGLR